MRTNQFLSFERRVKRDYLGQPVPSGLKKLFRNKFNKKDIPEFALLLAKKRGLQIDKFKIIGKGVILNE